MIDLTRYNLTAKMELSLIGIKHESGPDSPDPDHVCRVLPWPSTGCTLIGMGLIDYNKNRGWSLTHNGRAVLAALCARSGRRPR